MSNGEGHELRAVVADDDPDVLLLVELTLRSIGVSVTKCTKGRDAITEVLTSRPDVLILDVKMPEVSGLDVLKRVRADARLADLPVVLVTAQAQDSDIELGLALGANFYVTKPFSPRDLAMRVQGLLQDRQDG